MGPSGPREQIERRAEGRPEADLMRRAQRGERWAFDALCQKITPVIDSVLYRRLGPGQVEDARQEALLRAWARKWQYRPERGAVARWVIGIAVNVARDAVRARKRRKACMIASIDSDRAGALAIADKRPDPAAAAATAAWAEHLSQRLARVLAVAKPPARLAWELRQQGVPYTEIARRLGKKVPTLATWIHRIRKAVNKTCNTRLPDR